MFPLLMELAWSMAKLAVQDVVNSNVRDRVPSGRAQPDLHQQSPDCPGEMFYDAIP